MNLLLVLAFLFYSGSLCGWCIELIWRRFFSGNNPERKWINPGFLVGPYLPLYGFSLCVLCMMSFIDLSFIENPVLQKIILFVIMALVITLIEYVAGLIFIHGMKIKLWDYSTCWGNIQGIICPLYSFFWWLLSGLYYFLIHPHILESLYWLAEHLAFSFFIGFFYGVFAIDLFYSFNILAKIRAYAKEKDVVVRIEMFKESVRRKNAEIKEKSHFLLAFKSEQIPFIEQLKTHLEKMKNEN